MAAFILPVSMLGVLMVAISSQAPERIGCFSFNHGNTVLLVKISGDVESIAACIQYCRIRRATYAGVRYGHSCYCGDNHDHTVNGPQLSDSSCTTPCSDHSSLCGGQYSIVIYSVCSQGRYRDNTYEEPNCGASCNCKDNHICLYNHGSCPANCETGWSGEACNVRVVMPTTKHTTIKPEDEHHASSDEVSDMVTISTGYGVSAYLTSEKTMTTSSALSVKTCEGCPVAVTGLSATLCVTSVALVISIIVIIYLVYRQRVSRTSVKYSSAQIRALPKSAERDGNDTAYENMGGIQTEPPNYEQLGSRQTSPATYEELSMAGPTR